MNDDRPIERLLRRYAKKRREEAAAPLELHRATRRLLHGEVARQFPKTGAERHDYPGGWFAALRRRWLYTTAAVSAVLTAAVVFVIPNRPTRLAMKETELAQAHHEVAPAMARDKDLAAGERARTANLSDAIPTPTAAPALEPSPSPPPWATRAAPKSYSSGFERQPELGANTASSEFRRLNEKSTPATRGPTPLESVQPSPAQDRFREKAPQPAAAPEEYASVVSAARVGVEASATLPVTTLATSPVAGANPPAGRTSPSSVSAFADSKSGTITGQSPDTLSGVSLANESRAAQSPRTFNVAHQGEKSPVITQAFTSRALTQSVKVAAKISPVHPVLANFQIEQTGEELRVIDSDGSTYLGEVNSVPVTFEGERQGQLRFQREVNLAGRPTAAAPASTQQSAPDYFYRVAGTNRTLNQQVVFTWNLTPLTNPLTQSKTKARGDVVNQSNLGAPQQIQMRLQNSAIRGRAQINATKEIEINAVPVTR